MNRRRFIAGCGSTAALLTAKVSSAQSEQAPDHEQAVRIKVNTGQALGEIAQNFVGLGYEISSVAIPGLLSAANHTYVQLVRTLGTQGVIRIGGNTSDDASFSPNGKAVAAPKGTVVDDRSLRELGSFLDATGWKLIWGLNLGSGSEQNAVAEAQSVAAIAKGKLLAFEIGNEPDLFKNNAAHRPRNYSYNDYLAEFRRYKAAIRAKLPGAPFAGPDAAGATDWVTRFASDEGSDLKLLTHHYYRECAGPNSTLQKLLDTDPKLSPELQKLRTASTSAHVPYRICETNSFCGGGKPGVSDTFGAALWALDFMFTLAWADAGGLNMETGLNQLGFVSSYSPIGDDGHGRYSATPEYYGMLAFAQACGGQRLAAEYDSSGVNLAIYPVLRKGGRVSVTIINKDETRNARVGVTADRKFREASIIRLSAPSLQSKSGVTLGGSAVSSDGNWTPVQVERSTLDDRGCEIAVAAASAAIVTLAV